MSRSNNSGNEGLGSEATGNELNLPAEDTNADGGAGNPSGNEPSPGEKKNAKKDKGNQKMGLALFLQRSEKFKGSIRDNGIIALLKTSKHKDSVLTEKDWEAAVDSLLNKKVK